MAITSTKRHLASVTGRLCEPRTLSSTSVFRGAINPVFVASIKSRWGRTGQSHFGPVAKEFYKPGNPLHQFESPRAKQAGLTTYTFSPTIRLTFSPLASSNSAIHVDGRRVFRKFTTRSAHSAGPRGSARQAIRQTNNAGITLESRGSTMFPVAPRSTMFVVAGGSGSNARSSSAETNNAASRGATMFVVKPRSTIFIVAGGSDGNARSSSVGSTTSGAVAPALLTTAFCAAMNHSISIYGPGVDRKYLPTVFALGRSAASSSQFVLTRSDQGLAHPTATQCLAATSRLSMTSVDAAPLPRAASPLRSLTTVAMDFAAPRVADAEAVSERLAHFVSAPAMTYAKPKQDSSEGVIQALRDLRTSQPKRNTAVAPQWPSIEQLTSQVRTQLERDLRIERERRGL